MKKIIVGIFAFAFLLVAHSSFASVSWNGASNDCKGISIINATTNEGYENPCWPNSSVSADAGDTINVRIYYHNTGTETATNTKVILNAPSGSSTSKSFSGRIISDQGSLSLGSVSARLSSSQTLTFTSAKWYTENTRERLTPFINGQNGSEAVNGELSIGSVAPGWASQGSVVIAFKVSNVVVQELCKDPSATNYNGPLPCKYPEQLCKDPSATNYNGPLPCRYVIIDTTGNISASPSSCVIAKGSSACNTTLTWNTNNGVGASVVKKNNIIIATGNNDSKILPISNGSSTFYLYNNSKQLDSVTVSSYCASGSTWNGAYCREDVVVQLCKDPSATNYNGTLPCKYPEQLCKDTGAINYNGSLPCQYRNPDPTGTISLSPSSCTIGIGDSTCNTTLTWSTNNGVGTSSVTKTGSQSVASGNNGSKTVTVSNGSTSFYLYNNSILLSQTSAQAYCSSGSTWNGSYCRENVTPTYACSIDTFTSNSTSIYSGDTATLNWDTENCTTVDISNVGNNLTASGSKTVRPTQTTTYTISGTGSNGSKASRSVTITVSQNPSYHCSISSFTTNSTSIRSGDSVTLTWDTENCTTVNISGVGSNLSASGQKTVYPTQTTTYTLSANSSGSYNQSRSVTVVVSGNSSYVCAINTFISNASSITSGDGVTLTWDTENCTTVNISGVGTNLSPSGQKTVYPTTTTTYTLSGNSSGWSKPSRTVTVIVSNAPKYSCEITSFTASDTNIEEGDSVTLNWNTEDCNNVSISNIGDVSKDGSDKIYPDESTTYTITAYDSWSDRKTKTVRIYVDESNNDDEDEDTCSISSFTASDTYITEGDEVRLRWNTDSCDYVKITDLGSVDKDGSKYVDPSVTTTYEMTAYNSGESKHYKTVKIYVDDNTPVNPVVIYNSSVVTTLATNISQAGVTINGIVTNSKAGNVNTYFEYGTSVNLGQRTISRTVNSNSNFSEYVNGLMPNTIYYFRAVSEGSNGTSRGAIEIFRTQGEVVNQTTTKYVYVGGGTTVTGTSSPIMLEIVNRYEGIGRKDIIDYTITYKNISKSTLTDSVLQVIVPKGVTIVNASEGTYSNDTHTLSVELDDLTPGEDGVVYLQGRVDSMPVDQAKIVSTAVLVYTSNSGAQENAIAYVLNVPKNFNGNVLGASAFWSGFGGFGFIGWLLLIILILLIIIIVRTYRRKVVTTNNGQVKTETHY